MSLPGRRIARRRPSLGAALLVAALVRVGAAQALPSPILHVGSGQPYATIAAAIGGAQGHTATVVVHAGVHASFAIGPAAADHLRIVAAGDGPVSIDTNLGPIVVSGTRYLQSVEFDGLTIGSPTAPAAAIVLNGNDGVVLVTSCVVASGGAPALDIQSCIKTAIQKSTFVGLPGLQANGVSEIHAWTTNVATASLAPAVAATFCGTPAPVFTTPPGPAVTTIATPMYDLATAATIAPGSTLTIGLTLEPLGGWILAAALEPHWVDPLEPSVALITLINPLFGALVLAVGQADPSGAAAASVFIPNLAYLDGLQATFQFLGTDLLTGGFRTSHTATTMIALP